MIIELDKFNMNDAHGNDDLNIHKMNTLNNETKQGGNDTQFCNLSFIYYKYRECKKYRVGCKTCIRASRYIINIYIYIRNLKPTVNMTVEHVLTKN
jgi:hypothetical protein